MARYFFHLHNDLEVADDEGREFSDLAAATEYAAKQVRQLAGEVLKDTGRLVLSHHLDIEDDGGTVLASIKFGDVVRVEP